MAGIVAFGAYIPFYRLSLADITQLWSGTTLVEGEKAVASYDEDSVTMAVESARDLMGQTDPASIDGLYFASTTPPFREKQSAGIVAAALDLGVQILTADFTDSLRAGTSALKAAVHAVDSGSARQVLVTISDCRVPPPDSEFELIFGDGAAAFLIGASEIAVNMEGSHQITSPFLDVWRLERERYPRTWEDRFIYATQYLSQMEEATSALMKKDSLGPQDFSRFVFYAPDARRHAEIARRLGFDAKTQVQSSMFNVLGDTGAAFAPMMLVAALEEAQPGDRILFASYGDGCDAYVLRVTEQIKKLRDRRGIRHHLASKRMLSGYGKYARFRRLMDWGPEVASTRTSSPPIIWREGKQLFSLYGHKCRQCGGVQYPMQRVCIWCQAKDDFDEIKLSDKRGTVFTYNITERGWADDLPIITCVVDMDVGGRLTLEMTDRDPEKIEVGIPVELTFRKIHEGGGFPNYFWKCRPPRC